MKIVSGGQTGVDQAALDVAMELGLACGGWCPLGRRNDIGTIDAKYPLVETPSHKYPQRTKWNVRDSDGTLILTRGKPDGGTALTARLARHHGKPYLVVNFEEPVFPEVVAAWLDEQRIATLNVAGPRESTQPGIGAAARDYFRRVLQAWQANQGEEP